jgi:t-SNARE complex subunit (syntaxin)
VINEADEKERKYRYKTKNLTKKRGKGGNPIKENKDTVVIVDFGQTTTTNNSNLYTPRNEKATESLKEQETRSQILLKIEEMISSLIKLDE